MTVTTDATPGEARRWLARQLLGHRLTVAATVALGLIEALATLGQLALFAWLIDQVVTGRQPVASLLPCALGLPALIALRAAGQLARERLAQRLAERIRHTAQIRVLERWGQAGPVVLSGQSPGALTTELLEQTDALTGYYARYLPQAALALLVPLIVLITVLRLDWLAGVFLFLSAPLIPLFMALVGMGAESLNRQHFTELSRLSGHFLDRVRNLTTLRLFSQTQSARAQVHSAAEHFREISMKTLRLAFLSSAVLEFFASVAIAVVAIYIGFGLLGYIEFGPAPDLTLFSGLLILLLAPEFFQPLRQFAQHYHDRASALGAAGQLAHTIPNAPAAQPISARQPLPTALPDPLVQCLDLGFHYTGRNPVLERVTFNIHPGEWLALAGPTGAGKSTFLRLLAGFAQPTRGELSIAGRPPEYWRLGWLDQHPWFPQATWRALLTSNTIAPPSTADLHHALRLVGLDQRLAADADDLDSVLPEGAYGLSGGQARRLALARLYLSGHRLLLLDEPTAGLDAQSAAGILDALANLHALGCTLVMVSHDPGSLARADRVITLSGGCHAQG